MALYRLLGKVLIYDHHDLAPEMYYARSHGSGSVAVYRILRALEWLSCRLASHIIVTNESYRATDIGRNHVPPEEITVVRNAPKVKLPHSATVRPGRRKDDTYLVGYFGVMGVQDGVDHLLRALHHLVYDFGRDRVRAVLIGAGDAWSMLHSMTKELGLSDCVHFTGWLPLDEAIPVLVEVDVAVEPAPSNPYNDRSTMIKVMEYMALGKPIVAFDLPENRFSAQDAAMYVPPNDEMAFARAIATLMDHPERSRHMGALGRARVEKDLTWDRSAENLGAAYRQASARKRHSSSIGHA